MKINENDYEKLKLVSIKFSPWLILLLGFISGHLFCGKTIKTISYPWEELTIEWLFYVFATSAYLGVKQGYIRNRSLVKIYKIESPNEYWFYIYGYKVLCGLIFISIVIKWSKFI